MDLYLDGTPGCCPAFSVIDHEAGKMRTIRGLIIGAVALMLSSTVLPGTAQAAAEAPAAPYTAFTMHLEGWSVDGSFSYEASRNTLQVFQQDPNGYALSMSGSTSGHWHSLNVSPPIGTRFTAGQSYSIGPGWSPVPSATVFNVSGDGRGCEFAAHGTLTVSQADYDDATGKFTAFAASYSLPCLSDSVVKGEIRFQSSIGYKATDSREYRLQLGQQPAGQVGTPKDITVEVNGTQPTTFGTASLSGTNPGAFQISANTCSGKTLSYGETCKLTITPKATALGAQTALLTLVEDSTAGRVVQLLSLTGFDPRDATVYWPYFEFDWVTAYDTSAPKTVTVTGASDLPITFGKASITGTNPAWFKVTDDGCSLKTLAKGQTCSMTAVARPAASEPGDALISLPDDSFAGSTQIPLAVNGFNDDRGTYYTVPPRRIMDTRSGAGAPRGAVGSGGVVSLQVGVPSDASAVVLNVTVTEAAGPGYVTVYPSGVARPTASSLNYVKGWTGANSVTVKVGANGKVDFYNAGGPAHLIADVYGYYSKGHDRFMTGCPGCGQYHPLAQPVRLADTRDWGAGRVPAGHYINAVASWNTTINPRVRAFAVNITATAPTGGGYLTAWNGYAGGLPNTSTLNYTANATVPNFAVVPTTPCNDCGTATGLPSIGVYSSTNAHIIVDIVGFYDDSSLPGGLRFEPVVPSRIADTRSGQGWPSRLGPAATASITAPSSVANIDTRALATNVTAVLPTTATYLTVWPSGSGRPGTSNLNPTAGSVVPNAVQTMIGADKKFNVFNAGGYCDVVVDVVGTFYQYPPSTPSGWSTSTTDPALVTPAAKSPAQTKQL
ncbi:choice-of-anchor D domain-containing protein [Dactylosporangium sp. AC04546]|uniref:choice-of-anchor D domain-containing protein n=1 Tax=Dactylosporangium sp. AC04546 TaxID=2862460 RepID=UPI002E7B2373|nr:choice-of-anchor D domain-containing protein [Dactylosporangium sp. AC04546]WVK84213.1 choice-of-anchor D domain-containing protein [Dactylosporangium sp. AC04546]